jgi:hypothetical protein
MNLNHTLNKSSSQKPYVVLIIWPCVSNFLCSMYECVLSDELSFDISLSWEIKYALNSMSKTSFIYLKIKFIYLKIKYYCST